MAHTLTILDPQQIAYENDILQLAVLGGVRLEGLDRMRVTLRVEVRNSPRPPVRHNLDLYNDNQLEKFIRQCAGKLEIGTTVIAASLSELTTLLEQYRLQQLQLIRTEEAPIKKLTEADRATAIEHLQHTHLMEQTLKDLQNTGIQGEEDNMQSMVCHDKQKNTSPLSLICLARSGTGKSYLMEKVAACIPEEADGNIPSSAAIACITLARRNQRLRFFDRGPGRRTGGHVPDPGTAKQKAHQ